DLLGEGLRAAGFDVFEPEGTFFTMVDASPLGIDDATALARRLPSLIGVAAIPVAMFCHRPARRWWSGTAAGSPLP
ncbi:hypothetical protein FNH21_16695, partial [Arthrobacter sp. KR32]|nr:hypothetical protein [Arthrobacter bussei]